MGVLSIGLFVLLVSQHHNVFVSGDTSTNPGLALVISQHGLDYAAQVAIDQIVSDVKGKSIPDQHGQSRVAIGKVNYDVTGMRITSFTPPSSQVTINAGRGITWSLSGAGAAVHGNWRYKYKKAFIHISDHGSFDVSLRQVSLGVGITLSKDKDGRPTISTTSCSCNVGDVDVKFHGGASWLYNLFKDALENPISKAIKKVMCDSVNKAINVNAAKSLAKMKIVFPIEGLFNLDYRLVAPPVFGAGFIESLHKGEIFWHGSTTEAPFPPGPLAPPRVSKMVQFCLSDYITNTLGYVLQTHGFLQYNLTKKDLPKENQAYLNTTCSSGICIGSILPILGKTYPKGSVELAMKTSSRPTLSTTSKAVVGKFVGILDMNVRLPDSSLHHALSANMEARMALNVSMVGNKVIADVHALRFNVTKVQSDVGKLPAAFLQTVLKFAANRFILPQLKEIGKKGLKLPGIDHVEFSDAQLTMYQGVLCFATNVKYDTKLRFHPYTD